LSSMNVTESIPIPVTLDTGIGMVVKIEWNFSYRLRVVHSEKYNEIKEEIMELERIKEKKNVLNLVKILDEFRTDVLLT